MYVYSMYVCMYVCVFMYFCMYVCMYICMYACMYAYMYVCMYACMHDLYGCVCMYYLCVCMHKCIIIFMSTSLYAHCLYMYTHAWIANIRTQTCMHNVPFSQKTRNIPLFKPYLSMPFLIIITTCTKIHKHKYKTLLLDIFLILYLSSKPV